MINGEIPNLLAPEDYDEIKYDYRSIKSAPTYLMLIFISLFTCST